MRKIISVADRASYSSNSKADKSQKKCKNYDLCDIFTLISTGDELQPFRFVSKQISDIK